MDVRAILLVGAPATPDAARFGGRPLALLDVLGKTLVEHVADRMRHFGVEEIAIVTTCKPDNFVLRRTVGDRSLQWHATNEDGLWRKCEQVFGEHAQSGAELVLVWRLGAYTEMNFDQFIQFHLDQAARVSSAADANGPLEIFAISASRRNDAAFLFRHALMRTRDFCSQFLAQGYVNRMQNVEDMHRLAQDGLYQRIGLRPSGKEIRPGIWTEGRMRVERGVRILAPAFIGSGAKIRATAVLTRGAAIEHHAEVDCGTVVENSSVLPFSYIGAGLDICHAVVGFRRLAHLLRKIEVEIADRRLLSMKTSNAPRRVAGALANLAKVVPVEIVRGIFASSADAPALEILPGMHALAPASSTSISASRESERRPIMRSNFSDRLENAMEFPADFENDFIPVRRYGNH